MSPLSADRWTVIATRKPGEADWGRWQWLDGRNPRAVHAMSDANAIVLMQRERGGVRELVARQAGMHWRRLQLRFSRTCGGFRA